MNPPRPAKKLFPEHMKFPPGFDPFEFALFASALLLAGPVVLAADYQISPQTFAVSAGASTAGPYQVWTVIGQPNAGRSVSQSYRADLGFASVLGSSPVAAPVTRVIPAGGSALIPFEELLQDAFDPDGDPLLVGPVVTPSDYGGLVIADATSVSYTCPIGFYGVDHFTYVLIDGAGDVTTGTVALIVGDEEGSKPAVVYGPVISGGALVVRYAGRPGASYTIESTEELAPATWRKEFNVTAPAQAGIFGPGVFEMRRQVGDFRARYFRTVHPSY